VLNNIYIYIYIYTHISREDLPFMSFPIHYSRITVLLEASYYDTNRQAMGSISDGVVGIFQ
jgi:hypothetical protein